MKKITIDKIKNNWKEYLKQYGLMLVVLMLGIVIGKTTTEFDTIKQIIINVVSGIMTGLPLFILIFVGIMSILKAIKVVGKEIVKAIIIGFEKLIKNIPNWLIQFDTIKTKHRNIDKAIDGMRKF
jgi:hypothetical protein